MTYNVITKRVKNDGSAIKCEYAGNDVYFDAGEERDVEHDMADSLQHRYSHLGLHIVHPDPSPRSAGKGVKMADAQPVKPEPPPPPVVEEPVPEPPPVVAEEPEPEPAKPDQTKRKK